MSKPSRRKREEHEEHENHERWAVSYMDMVTVLMCLFIVLFAMATIDQEKYEELKNSLATGFGQEPSESTDMSEGVVVPEEMLDEEGQGFFATENAAQAELNELEALRSRIAAKLAELGLTDAVEFTLDERGLGIRLVGTQTFFASDSAELTDLAQQALDVIGPEIATTDNQISVEGHADLRQTGQYADNWELSSARATSVLRRLVEVSHIVPEHIGATGYGDARPIASGTSPEELAANRRVDVVVIRDVKAQEEAAPEKPAEAEPAHDKEVDDHSDAEPASTGH
ncbi:OmpA/MotB family protein [Herbiconiux sp. SYSU D00978]|uniref:OmpA/MotB family protein n=1 Tax=Herbiconiux sp. SYSU D00978 TaxID=2812562 RepID=UPI001A97AB7F|nr:flagellar motor protein MotB [Herbiconiux sp. SYSU D00978]